MRANMNTQQQFRAGKVAQNALIIYFHQIGKRLFLQFNNIRLLFVIIFYTIWNYNSFVI